MLSFIILQDNEKLNFVGKKEKERKGDRNYIH